MAKNRNKKRNGLAAMDVSTDQTVMDAQAMDTSESAAPAIVFECGKYRLASECSSWRITDQLVVIGSSWVQHERVNPRPFTTHSTRESEWANAKAVLKCSNSVFERNWVDSGFECGKCRLASECSSWRITDQVGDDDIVRRLDPQITEGPVKAGGVNNHSACHRVSRRT
uniref:Uncharacterized protein n=1 Tax=Solanum tuberosum TaxID=4113 RepID=M1ALB9_SOLTU